MDTEPTEDNESELEWWKGENESRSDTIDDEQVNKVKFVAIESEGILKAVWRCEHCAKVLSSKQRLQKHVQSHNIVQFKCELCSRQFRAKGSLISHMNMHTGEQLYKCLYCPKVYSKTSLKQHERKHIEQFKQPSSAQNRQPSFRIRLTTKEFYEALDSTEVEREIKNAAKSHEAMVKELKFKGISFKCKLCSLTFSNLLLLNQHRETHSTKKVYQCSYCPKKFMREAIFVYHQKTHSETNQTKRILPQPIENNKLPDSFKYCCYHCRQVFADEQSLKAHEEIHSDGIKCGWCHHEFETQSDYEKHLPCEKNPNRCEQCNRVPSNIVTHRCVPRDEIGPFNCSWCSKRFLTLNKLKMHEKLHNRTDPYPFRCDQCPKKYASIYNLRAHTKIHTGIDLCICPTCGKQFTTKYLLALHETIHSEDRPFCCSYCARTFKAHWTLRDHERIHQGVKKYECELCGKRFTQSSTLWRHRKLVHGKTQHDVCKKPNY